MRQILEIRNKNIEFKLKLSETITMVFGDGNTGKTCIFNFLKNYANKGKLKNIIFIDMTTLYNVDILKTNSSALFLIDDYDVVKLMRPEIIELLNKTGHQALIFGRDIEGLRVDKRYLYYAKRKNNHIFFDSVMPVTIKY